MGTPGVKEKGLENHSAKGDDVNPAHLDPAECAKNDSQNLSDVNADQSVRSVSPGSMSPKSTAVKFSPDPVSKIEVLAYSDQFPIHPSRVIISKLGIHEMQPHMDRFTGKSPLVMAARKAKLMASRDINAANKRRQIILDQLACNGKLWLDQCTVNMNVNKLIHFHCPMGQENWARQSQRAC